MKRLLRLVCIVMLLGIMLPAKSEDVLASSVRHLPAGELDVPAQQQISPLLEEALQLLEESGPEGSMIADAIRNTGTTAGFEDELPKGSDGLPKFLSGPIAAYHMKDNVISINPQYRHANVLTLGAILAHEGTHVNDYQISGRYDRPIANEQVWQLYSAVVRELDAFDASVRYWAIVYPATAEAPEGGKPIPVNSAEVQLNTLLRIHNTKEARAIFSDIICAYMMPNERCQMTW